MALFNRGARLVVGQPGQNGAVEIEDLRIAFSISKTAGKTPNNSDIRVWNLKRATRDAMERPNTRCVLYAGYHENEQGLVKIFEGDVAFAWSKNEGADVVTNFELKEGFKAYRDTAVSLSYGSGVSSERMLRDIAGQMGLGLTLPEGVEFRTWANGFSSHGAARSALDRITRANGLSWSIQVGNIQIVRTGGSTTRRAVVLSANSGMVDSPERQREGPREAAQVTDAATRRRARVSAARGYDGWVVKSLLMPFILPSDPVKLEANNVDGVFIAREVRHVGDTMQGDFQTELKLVTPEVDRRLNQQRRERGTTGARGSTNTTTTNNIPIPPIPPGEGS